MKNKFYIPFAALVLTACGAKHSGEAYTVEVQMLPEAEGQMAYMMNFDDGEKIDSVVVENGVARFSGEVEKPLMARVVVDGQRGPLFVVEGGTVSVDSKGTASGTPLNDALENYSASAMAIRAELQGLPSEEAEALMPVLLERYNALTDSTMEANIDNPVGYYLFLQQAYEMTLPELQAAVESHPALNDYKRVQSLVDQAQRKAATGVGNKYLDFEVTGDQGTQRLSDYVGSDGKYLLVDFWASWCGPCIRETKVIKELYEKYGDKGLNVLGVAVWDEPDNTLEAIERHQLPWPQIINAQSIPTELYGINAIPCIILIDPEGNIVSRDKQDADLVADVEAAMAAYAAAN